MTGQTVATTKGRYLTASDTVKALTQTPRKALFMKVIGRMVLDTVMELSNTETDLFMMVNGSVA